MTSISELMNLDGSSIKICRRLWNKEYQEPGKTKPVAG